MIGWAILNVLTSLIPTMIIVYKLANYPEHFNALERIGMGMLGCALTLSVAPILGKAVFPVDTPFDDWSRTMLGLGLTVDYIGRIMRDRRDGLMKR